MIFILKALVGDDMRYTFYPEFGYATSEKELILLTKRSVFHSVLKNKERCRKYKVQTQLKRG